MGGGLNQRMGQRIGTGGDACVAYEQVRAACKQKRINELVMAFRWRPKTNAKTML